MTTCPYCHHDIDAGPPLSSAEEALTATIIAAADLTGLRPSEITAPGRRPKAVRARFAVAAILHDDHELSNADVGHLLNRDPSSISHARHNADESLCNSIRARVRLNTQQANSGHYRGAKGES